MFQLIYHNIVQRKLRAAFALVNAGHFAELLKGFRRDCRHSFVGDHALGGERNTAPAVERWYARLGRVFPGLTFHIQDIQSSGTPWNTLAAVAWEDSGNLASGAPYRNQGVHWIRLRWGRVAELRIHCDTELLKYNLGVQREFGIEEAEAAAITDGPASSS